MTLFTTFRAIGSQAKGPSAIDEEGDKDFLAYLIRRMNLDEVRGDLAGAQHASPITDDDRILLFSVVQEMVDFLGVSTTVDGARKGLGAYASIRARARGCASGGRIRVGRVVARAGLAAGSGQGRCWRGPTNGGTGPPA